MKNNQIKACSLKKSNKKQEKPVISTSDKSGDLTVSSEKNNRNQKFSPQNILIKNIKNSKNIQSFETKLQVNPYKFYLKNESKSNSGSSEIKNTSYRTGQSSDRTKLIIKINPSKNYKNKNFNIEKKPNNYEVNTDLKSTHLEKKNKEEKVIKRHFFESYNNSTHHRTINYYINLIEEKESEIKKIKTDLQTSKEIISLLSKDNLEKISHNSAPTERELIVQKSQAESANVNLKTDRSQINQQLSINNTNVISNNFLKANIKSKLNEAIFKSDESIKTTSTNDLKFENDFTKNQYTTERNMEDIIKKALKFLEKSSSSKNMTNFDEHLNKIRQRSHLLLRKYSESLLELKNQIIKENN